MGIGTVIRKIRKNKGLSLETISNRANISKTTMIKIENEQGINSSILTLNKIAKSLNVNVVSFILDKEIPYNSNEYINQMELIGRNVREIRTLKNISGAMFRKEGVSKATLSEIENANSFGSIEKLYAIAKVLNVRIEDLFLLKYEEKEIRDIKSEFNILLKEELMLNGVVMNENEKKLLAATMEKQLIEIMMFREV